MAETGLDDIMSCAFRGVMSCFHSITLRILSGQLVESSRIPSKKPMMMMII